MAKAIQPIMIDGVPLKEQLARAERRKKYIALGMVLPLLLFIIVTFAIPILSMLFRSVDNPRMTTLVPNLAAAVLQWDGIELPSEQVFEIAFHDLTAAKKAGHLGKIATHVNYSLSGGRSLILKTKAQVQKDQVRALPGGHDQIGQTLGESTHLVGHQKSEPSIHSALFFECSGSRL